MAQYIMQMINQIFTIYQNLMHISLVIDVLQLLLFYYNKIYNKIILIYYKTSIIRIS
jgi:hypothetical protein